MAVSLLWRGFGFAYGVFMLGLMTSIAAIRDGAFTRYRKMSDEEKRELALAQKKYWDVSENPIKGFRHAFYVLRNGVKLHYVINNKAHEETKAKNIAIFIHGFPDSYLLWRNILPSPSLAPYTLIAVDLPGYGGSDSLEKYDPEGILEAMTGFILGMRELYLEEEGKLVMVTHDWGSVAGARLASEAKQLADRWIIASTIIPKHAEANSLTLLASSRQMLHTSIRQPFSSFRLLKASYTTVQPLFSQIRRSFYVFILNLPWPLAIHFACMGNYWFLRLMHLLQAGLVNTKGEFKRRFTPAEAAEWLAASTGPGIGQFSDAPEKSPDSDLQYPESVKQRIADLGMSHKIRYYREGLALGTWEKSIETVVALSELPERTAARSGSGGMGLFDDGPPGALKVPTTLIYGRYDPAFERRLGLNGIADYLTKGSQVLVLDKSGHWLPYEEFGARVIGDVAAWALGGEEKALSDRVGGVEGVDVFVNKG